ncbi:MAG: type I glutamate--ammonia ligase, partial [bacterium]|nr:type I glutamate--ammonia ligase [bacterium]
YAGIDGILSKKKLRNSTDINLFKADQSVTKNLDVLPLTLKDAVKFAQNSEFIKKHLPEEIVTQLKA